MIVNLSEMRRILDLMCDARNQHDEYLLQQAIDMLTAAVKRHEATLEMASEARRLDLK